MWSCLNHAIHGWNDGIGISQTDLINFFTQMGYAPDTLYLEGITPLSVNIKDVYRQLPDRPDIVTRIERTIGSSDEPSTLTSDDRYRCVGHQRLPMVSSDSGGFTTGQRGGDIPRLVFTHARQQHQGWQTLQPHPDPGEWKGPTDVAAGDMQVRGRLFSSAQYQIWPEVPADDERARALITMLGCAIPRAKDLPSEDIYAAYDRFLNELQQRRSDPQHTTARLRFIDRVERVPDNN